jgi:hypothetical protein
MRYLLYSLCAIQNWVGAHGIPLDGTIFYPSWHHAVYLPRCTCSVDLRETPSKPCVPTLIIG